MAQPNRAPNSVIRTVFLLLSVLVSLSNSQTCTPQQCGTLSGASLTNASSCPANSATLTNNAISIMNCTCVAGAFASPTPNGVPCTQCPPGSFSAVGSTACTLCGKGTYSTTIAAVAIATCINCAGGTYGTGYGYPAPATCTLCSPGTYSLTVSGASSPSTCSSCSTGSYSTASGATTTSVCTTCPVNKFCSTLVTIGFLLNPFALQCGTLQHIELTHDVGAQGALPANCVNAPTNSYYTSTGITQASCPWVCNVGYSLDKTTNSSCIQCAAGSYCYANTSYSCLAYTNSPAQSTSNANCSCVPGAYGTGVASACSICTPSSYCPGIPVAYP